MATDASFPKWLLDSREHTTSTKEWNHFTGELHDAIQQQLTESRVESFADLTDTERSLFLDRAILAIQDGQPFKDLYSRVAVSLDQHMNNNVARQLLEEFPINTKTDLILEAALEGSVSLLKKWPDLKSKLHVCINRPLPEPLRQLAWRLFLENTKVRAKYHDLLTNDPRSAISPLDLEISQKCEQLLTSEPTFEKLRGSVGAFYAMKAVLSYHHALMRSNHGLPDIHHLLAVPFVQNAEQAISRREPASGKVVTLLVEQYQTFMQHRPGYMEDTGSEANQDEMTGFVARVIDNLEKWSPQTLDIIVEAFFPRRDYESYSSFGEQVLATEQSSHDILVESITTLTRPIIRALFVGYCNMEVVMFIWDQYIIGLDVPGYHSVCLSAYTAILFKLLTEKIKNCQSPSALETTIRTESVKFTVPQFQFEVNRCCLPELKNALSQGDKAAMPVLDPTQVKHPPWTHWHNEKIPGRMGPQERRRAREEREAERERLKQQELDEELRRKEAVEKIRREEDEKFMRQAAQENRRRDEERMALEDQLEDERRRRIEGERAAEDEINQLRQEIEQLKAIRTPQKSPAPSAITLGSVISQYLLPPPPTPASRLSMPVVAPRLSRLRTPTPNKPAEEQAADVVLDFLKRVAHSFNKVGHGEGNERRDVDDATKDAIAAHKEDVKAAELEVFGKPLGPGDWDRLSQEEQEEASDRIMDVIRERMKERRRREMDNQNRRP